MNTYRPNIFSSVEDMDKSVDNHIYHNADKLPVSNRKILRVIAAHAFSPVGTAHLKISTIATEAGCSETTVGRAIKRLKDLQILRVEQGTKKNGIQGANFYSILPFTADVKERVREREMTERDNAEKPRSSKVQHVKTESETCISFELGFNPFVSPVSNNVNARDAPADLKQQLRDIYKPNTSADERAFDELCRIAFGRLKQYLHSHKVPYLQLEQIVIRCMQQLVAKQGVRNQFAMYSKMIERQVLQLFEQPISPVIGPNVPQMDRNVSRNKEVVPEWFNRRNDERKQPVPSTTVIDIDFEAERQKILAKIGRYKNEETYT